MLFSLVLNSECEENKLPAIIPVFIVPAPVSGNTGDYAHDAHQKQGAGTLFDVDGGRWGTRPQWC